MGQFKTAVSTAEVEIWLDYESSVWMYKGTVVICLKESYPSNCLEVLRKNAINLNNDDQYPTGMKTVELLNQSQTCSLF